MCCSPLLLRLSCRYHGGDVQACERESQRAYFQG